MANNWILAQIFRFVSRIIVWFLFIVHHVKVPHHTPHYKEQGSLFCCRLKHIRTQASATSLSLATPPRDWQCIYLPSPAANINYSSSLSLPSQPWYTSSYFNARCLAAPVWPFALCDVPKPSLPPPQPGLSFLLFPCLSSLPPFFLRLFMLPSHEHSEFSEDAISSPHHPLMLHLQEKKNKNCMTYVWTISIRPLVYGEIIEQFIFYYMPVQLSTAKL